MNYGSLRRYLNLRYMKAPGDGGAGGGGSTSSGSDVGAPPASGDGGVAVPPPSDGGEAPPPPSPDTSDPWAALGQTDFDEIEVPPVEAAPAPPAPPAPEVPPAQAPSPVAPQPQTPSQQPQTPPVQPQQPTQPQSGAEAPPADLSPSDPVGMADAIEANRGPIIEHLAQTRYALTPEEVQAIETDAVSAIPKLLARVHVESQMAMQRFLAQAVPGMIQKHTTVVKANDAAESKFFDAHKQLGLDKNNAQHRQVAVRMAKMYRGMYPDASLDQLISDIGPMVARAVGVNGQPTPQPQTPGVPQTPQIVRGGQPFRPAVNGAGPVPQATPTDDNPWAGIGVDYD